MNERSKLVLLQDHTLIADVVKEKQAADQAAKLCAQMQKKIEEGKCDLVDLLEPLPNRPRRSPMQDVQLIGDQGKGPQTQNYVGLFQLGREQVVITSRFDQPGKPYFLYYLLETCWDAALLSLEELGSTYEKDLFDVMLVAKLAVQIQKAWKKGGLRQYRAFQHNDSRVRGPIDVPRHIRENLGLNNGSAAYRTRAYSLDNDYNVLLLQAVEAAERKYPALLRRLCRLLPELPAALRTLRQEAPGWAGVQRESVLRHTAQKIVNPIYRDYEPARVAARAILRRLGTDPVEGHRRHSEVTGVFLDMDELWERFLARALLGDPEGAAQNDFLILKKHVKIRPDFWWREKGVVLDAKNREAWGNTAERERWGKAVRDDVFQVLAYMLTLNCREGGVVFPYRERISAGAVEVSELCGMRRFWRIPVVIPAAGNYSAFARLMAEELESLKKLDVIRMVLT